jgi:ArsR family transcriptional regulator
MSMNRRAASRMGEAQMVRVLRALADPKRFRMVREIARAGELSCGQLGEKFAVSQPTVSHHLKLLVDAGILRVRQEGPTHYIAVDRELVEAVVSALPSQLGAEGAHGRRRATARR